MLLKETDNQAIVYEDALTSELKVSLEPTAKSLRDIASKADLWDYWTRISSSGDFLTTVPSYTLMRDPLRRLCHRLIKFSIVGRGQTPENVPYLLALYLFRFAFGRKQGAKMSGGQFITRLGVHLGVITEHSRQTLTVEVHGLTTIDIDELVRLRICDRLGDVVTWVVMGPPRQQVVGECNTPKKSQRSEIPHGVLLHNTQR
ncbi:hypothetical protein Tco_1268411 [Tanacetum coccineum]